MSGSPSRRPLSTISRLDPQRTGVPDAPSGGIHIMVYRSPRVPGLKSQKDSSLIRYSSLSNPQSAINNQVHLVKSVLDTSIFHLNCQETPIYQETLTSNCQEPIDCPESPDTPICKITNCLLPISNCPVPIAYYQCQIPNCQGPISK